MALLTEIALAKTLDLPKGTIRRWRVQEKMPCIRIGHRYYYYLEDVIHWTKEKQTESPNLLSKKQPLIYDI